MSADTDLSKDDEFFMLEETEDKRIKMSSSGYKKILTLVSAVIVGLFLLLALGLSLHTFKTKVPWIKNELSVVSFPLKGENLIISKVETHWEFSKKPVKEDELSELIYTPTSKITINKKSTKGKMRCFFVDGEGKYIGDPLTTEFSEGEFKEGKVLTFTSSTGFPSESEFNAYFSGFGNPWYIDILEGAESSTTLSQFKKLARIPLYYKIMKTP